MSTSCLSAQDDTALGEFIERHPGNCFVSRVPAAARDSGIPDYS